MQKNTLLLIPFLILTWSAQSQNFTNNDLNGTIGVSQIPTGWNAVPNTDPNCNATSFNQATADVTGLTGPVPGAGISGNPYSGTTFVSGNHSTAPQANYYFHEGIMQTVTGFTIGCTYDVNFYQTVVKQSNLIDTSGSWTVYFDNNLVGVSTPTISYAPFASNNLPWELRTLSFVATATSHTIKFLPTDDDANLVNSSTDLGGGLRMGIDSIFITSASSSSSINVLGNDTTICPSATFMLDATTPGATYLWHNSSTNPTFTVTQAGTFWVQITTGCSVIRDTITVSVSPLGSIDLGSDTSICLNQPITLNPSLGNNVAYLWQNNSTNSTLNVTQPGTYWVQITDSCGSYADTINVSLVTSGSVSLGNDTTICPNQTLTLNPITSGGNLSYLWQDNSTNSTYMVSQAGTYWVQITDSCGSYADTIVVSVQPNLSIDLGSDTTICNATYILNATTPGVSYLWQDNSTSSTFTVSQSGQYWVQIFDGCSYGSDTINITVGDRPIVDLGPDIIVCNTRVVDLDASFPGVSYQWHDNSTNATYSVSQPGTYWVSLTNECGSTSDTIVIDHHTTPPFYLGNDTSLCTGEKITLNSGLANVNFLWQDFSTQNTFTVEHEGAYALTVSDSCGSTRDDLYVSYKDCDCKVFVPNAFTPNNDNLNDKVGPLFNCGTATFEFFIYNRWGQQIFYTTLTNDFWDGTFKGKLAPIGTYYYLLKYEYSGQEKMIGKGDITLIR